MDPLSLLWLFFILASLQPSVQRQFLLAQRRRALRAISLERDTTVITLIHRQESMSLLGFPVVRYIDIDDAEDVLRAIRETPHGRAIEIILHTPGGLVVAARQIASALADHDGQGERALLGGRVVRVRRPVRRIPPGPRRLAVGVLRHQSTGAALRSSSSAIIRRSMSWPASASSTGSVAPSAPSALTPTSRVTLSRRPHRCGLERSSSHAAARQSSRLARVMRATSATSASARARSTCTAKSR
jgi:hypothetical protein